MKNIQIVPAAKHPISNWAGGTTTQLFIYPMESTLQNRDFDFRISSAKVEQEESNFSLFEGYRRQLLILEGQIEIYHENQYKKILKKLDVDEFSGDWKTSAKGKCIDFNIITSKEYQSSVASHQLQKDEVLQNQIKSDWFFIYTYKGSISVDISESNLMLNEGDLLVVSKQKGKEFKLEGVEGGELIVVELKNFL